MSASPPSVLAPAASNPTMNTQQQPQHSSPKMQQKKPTAQAARGTCPGDGRCNGTGGTSACAGCPTYNNVLNNAARLEKDLTDIQDNSPSVERSVTGGENFKNASSSNAAGSPGSSSGPRTRPFTRGGCAELCELQDKHNAPLATRRRRQQHLQRVW